MHNWIHFVVMDDWTAIYSMDTGEKLVEGHSIDAKHLLDALGVKYTSEDVSGYNDEGLPARAVDVPKWKSEMK